jgi:hypothetical protein
MSDSVEHELDGHATIKIAPDVLVQRLKAELCKAEEENLRLKTALLPLVFPFAHGEPPEKHKHSYLEIDCCVSITYADVYRAREALGVTAEDIERHYAEEKGE